MKPRDGARASFWNAFRSPRIGLMLGLGFASGLPNPLTGSTLSAWLDDVDVSLEAVGLFALVQLPYSFKFVWAPLLDRFQVRFGPGRRRGWMLLTQGLGIVAIGSLGSLQPVTMPFFVAILALCVAFFSATQDIASDAYRTEVLRPDERASGTAIFVVGYRLALIAASAGALLLSEPFGWTAVYWMLASTLAFGLVTTLLSPPSPNASGAPATLKAAVTEPFVQFWSRPGALRMLAVVALFKVGETVASQMMIPFLRRMDYSLAEIGLVYKGLGLAATIVGALLGGGWVARFGLVRSLVAFGLLQSFANLGYALLALLGRRPGLLETVIAVDNLLNGMGTAAFVAFLMSLCHPRYTATQYALLSSLAPVVGRLLAASSGWLANGIGWPSFFLLTTLAGIPAVWLIAGAAPFRATGAGPAVLPSARPSPTKRRME